MHKTTAKAKEREARLREIAGKYPHWKVAELMGCSMGAIQLFATNHGISLKYYRYPFREEEWEFINRLRLEMPMREVVSHPDYPLLEGQPRRTAESVWTSELRRKNRTSTGTPKRGTTR